jgi:DNA replication protein DnaC
LQPQQPAGIPALNSKTIVKESLKMEPLSDSLARLQDRANAGARALAVDPSDLGSKEVLCDLHGTFTSTGVRYTRTREIWSRCPDCEEARIARERKEEADRRAAQEVARMDALIGAACIPARFVGRTFDNFNASNPKQAEALSVVRSYAEQFDGHLKRGSGLILSGMPGTGKSHLAGAVLQAIMPAHCGMYQTCMGVIRNVRNTWRKDSERSETEVLRIYRDLPLLVIDEIGVQYGTDGEQTILFDLLDSRYRDMRPTILLTNQDKAGFKTYIGERSFDRLTETSRWIAFDWESYRPTARKEAA